MSEDRIAWLRSQIAIANDFARSLPETWIQERAEWSVRAEQLTEELDRALRDHDLNNNPLVPITRYATLFVRVNAQGKVEG